MAREVGEGGGGVGEGKRGGVKEERGVGEGGGGGMLRGRVEVEVVGLREAVEEEKEEGRAGQRGEGGEGEAMQRGGRAEGDPGAKARATRRQTLLLSLPPPLSWYLLDPS